MITQVNGTSGRPVQMGMFWRRYERRSLNGLSATTASMAGSPAAAMMAVTAPMEKPITPIFSACAGRSRFSQATAP